MKRRIISGTATAVALALTVLAHAGEHAQKSYSGSKEFERVKQLAGAWEGVMNMGERQLPMKVIYRVIAGGSAVVETTFPGTPMEMMSVYHDENGKLVMTHYCMLHNQPRMKLVSADEKTISLDFDDRSALDPATQPHMRSLTLEFAAADRLVQHWTMWSDGKQTGVNAIQLTRSKPVAGGAAR